MIGVSCMRMDSVSTKASGHRAAMKALGGISSFHKAISTRASIEATSGMDPGRISEKMDDTLRVPTRTICFTDRLIYLSLWRKIRRNVRKGSNIGLCVI